MGFLPVAVGFGLAFGLAISMFSYASAHVNPATLLALWILGDINGTDFLALTASEFAGAFVGAVLVFFVVLASFQDGSRG